MGTRMAPSYANIFMGKLETQLLEGDTDRPTVWWRYLDDVFIIWPHGKGCFKRFVEQINNMHPTIKFSANWLYKSVLSLDVKVTLNKEG